MSISDLNRDVASRAPRAPRGRSILRPRHRPPLSRSVLGAAQCSGDLPRGRDLGLAAFMFVQKALARVLASSGAASH